MRKLPPSSGKEKRITKPSPRLLPRICVLIPSWKIRDLEHRCIHWRPIPFQRYFTDTAIPTLYNQTKTEVMASLLKADRIAVTCDAWTSVTTKSFVTLTAHFVTDDWKLRSHVLQTRAMNERHTGANVAELLSNAVNEWDIAKKEMFYLQITLRIWLSLLSWVTSSI